MFFYFIIPKYAITCSNATQTFICICISFLHAADILLFMKNRVKTISADTIFDNMFC